jgi:hypothetical protein
MPQPRAACPWAFCPGSTETARPDVRQTSYSRMRKVSAIRRAFTSQLPNVWSYFGNVELFPGGAKKRGREDLPRRRTRLGIPRRLSLPHRERKDDAPAFFAKAKSRGGHRVYLGVLFTRETGGDGLQAVPAPGLKDRPLPDNAAASELLLIVAATTVTIVVVAQHQNQGNHS